MFVDMADNTEVCVGGLAVLPLPRRRPLVARPGLYYRPRRDGLIGPPYEFRYVDAVGLRRWEVVKGDVAAVEARRAELRASRPRVSVREPAGPQFGEVASEWLGRQTVGARTIEIYGWALRVHLVPYFGAKRLPEIDADDVALFIAGMRRQGFKGWTISSALRPLSIILAQAARKGSISVNPVSQLERAERPRHDDQRPKRILSLEEMHVLLAATASERERCLFELLLAAGLRIGEALGLTVGDLDRGDGIIRVEYQLSRVGVRTRLKTPDSRRVLDLPAGLFGALVALVEERDVVGNPQAFVFASRNETGVTRKTCRDGLTRAASAAGLRLPLPTLHDLRHSHASMLIGLGCNVSDVQHRLGHRKPDTTLRIYTHQWHERDVRKREIATRLDGLFPATP